MKTVNWASVEATQEFKKLVPGGYVCGIVNVEDCPDKEYLKVFYDITADEFKGYFKQLFDAKRFWGGSFFKSYKETALPFFKGFLTAIEKSNAGFTANNFDGDITKLKGKYIGLVLGEEEYISKENEVKKRLYVAQVHSIDKIKSNDFKVPELKKVETTIPQQEDTKEDDWDGLPF
jgi:hypothetical protein